MSKENFIQLSEMISNTKITLMKDINDFWNISPKSKYKYFKLFEVNSSHIREFLLSLEDETFYIVIPLITSTGKIDDPSIILSRQFIV